MVSTKHILAGVATLFTLSLPALAGQPGPYLKAPTTTYQTYKPAPAPKTTYSEDHVTRDLNHQSYERLRHKQATTPKYQYVQQAPVRHNPCYQPNPCAGQRIVTHTAPPTHTVRTTTPTVTRRVVHPAPTNPCYQPNPCATTYHRPVAVPPPPPRPIAPPPPPRHDWLAYNDCGGKTIRRLKDGRNDERRYEVCFSDLNYAAPHDRNVALLERIELASKKACRDTSFSSLYYMRAQRECRSEATEDAVFSANVPGLVDYYYAKNGKRRPNVVVHDPVMY